MMLILQTVGHDGMQFEPCVLSIVVYKKQIAWGLIKLPIWLLKLLSFLTKVIILSCLKPENSAAEMLEA